MLNMVGVVCIISICPMSFYLYYLYKSIHVIREVAIDVGNENTSGDLFII